jgi:hypothetical protein
MTRNRSVRLILAVVLAAALLVPAAVASAAGTGPATPPPVAITGPRLAPPAIPHSSVLDPYVIYNNLLVPPGLPNESVEANAADGGRTQEKPGRGIRQTATGVGFGLLLYSSPNVCNNFNPEGEWAAKIVKSDIWTDWFAGWAPFAINNGLYQAKNLTFSMERSVGPGNKWGANEHSAKIASNQPYAGGFGSPIIPVPAGYEWGKVSVTVNYLIWDHDTYGKEGGPDGLDYDWASMGVKPGAAGPMAVYVNGYVRGEWATLTNTIDLEGAKDIMVLLQGQSPGAFNSNIYFDNVSIAFIDENGTGKYLADCRYE